MERGSKFTTNRGSKRKPTETSIKKSKRQKLEEFSLERDFIPSKVFVFGTGDVGQLGLGVDELEKKRPSLVPELDNVVKVAAGGLHSVCLTIDGKVFTFGCNDEKALGRKTPEESDIYFPKEVVFPEDLKIVDISAGDSHTAVLASDGRVFIWGNFRDSNGPIGLFKPFESIDEPVLIPITINKRIKKISSGENHFAMLTEDGDIFTFGSAEFGQLGRVSLNHQERGGRSGLGLLLTPDSVRVRGNVKFNDLWAGAYQTVGRTTKGDVYGCGLNKSQQLLPNADTYMMTNMKEFNKLGESWHSFTFGENYLLAMTESKRLFVIGDGTYGNLGLGDKESKSEPTELTISNGDGVGISLISSCNRTSYAVMSDGSAFSWGTGSCYVLGHGADDDDVDIPTKIMGKQLEGRKVIEISPGCQHVLLRAIDKDSSKCDNVEKVIPPAASIEKIPELVAMETDTLSIVRSSVSRNNGDEADEVMEVKVVITDIIDQSGESSIIANSTGATVVDVVRETDNVSSEQIETKHDSVSNLIVSEPMEVLENQES